MRIHLNLNRFEYLLAGIVGLVSIYFSNSVLLSLVTATLVWLIFRGLQGVMRTQEDKKEEQKTFDFKTIRWTEVGNERLGRDDL